jgi:hypothetical protein
MSLKSNPERYSGVFSFSFQTQFDCSISFQGMLFRIAAHWDANVGRADNAASLASTILFFATPEASASHNSIGGHMMWL